MIFIIKSMNSIYTLLVFLMMGLTGLDQEVKVVYMEDAPKDKTQMTFYKNRRGLYG